VIAGMAATRDVGAGYEGQHRVVVAFRLWARELAKVSVEINRLIGHRVARYLSR
jgi:hypothetical protein